MRREGLHVGVVPRADLGPEVLDDPGEPGEALDPFAEGAEVVDGRPDRRAALSRFGEGVGIERVAREPADALLSRSDAWSSRGRALSGRLDGVRPQRAGDQEQVGA